MKSETKRTSGGGTFYGDSRQSARPARVAPAIQYVAVVGVNEEKVEI